MSPTSRPRLGRDNSSTRRIAARLRAESHVCALCGGPIDKALAWPHPGSFSVDHIVPLSMGGNVNDPANMRPAHLGCNSSRGNGTRRRGATGHGRRGAPTAPLAYGATPGPDGLPITPGDRSASW